MKQSRCHDDPRISTWQDAYKNRQIDQKIDGKEWWLKVGIEMRITEWSFDWRSTNLFTMTRTLHASEGDRVVAQVCICFEGRAGGFNFKNGSFWLMLLVRYFSHFEPCSIFVLC